jgi:hypothetical protein
MNDSQTRSKFSVNFRKKSEKNCAGGQKGKRFQKARKKVQILGILFAFFPFPWYTICAINDCGVK